MVTLKYLLSVQAIWVPKDTNLLCFKLISNSIEQPYHGPHQTVATLVLKQASAQQQVCLLLLVATVVVFSTMAIYYASETKPVEVEDGYPP